MGEIEETNSFDRIISIVFLTQGVLLLLVAIPLRLMPEFYVVLKDILWFQPDVAIWAFASAFLVRKRPKAEHTLIFVMLLFFLDLLGVIWSFNFEFFFWQFTPSRALHSVLFIIPGIVTLFYIPTMEVEKEDIMKFHHEALIEEIMAHDSMIEGLDYVLSYIDNPKYKFEPEYKQLFLDYISRRDDELGELARSKLKQTFEI